MKEEESIFVCGKHLTDIKRATNITSFAKVISVLEKKQTLK